MSTAVYTLVDANGVPQGSYTLQDPQAVAIINAGGSALDVHGHSVSLRLSSMIPTATESVSTAVTNGDTMATPLTGAGPGTPARPIYRMILPWPDGNFATGANYPGCSQTNTSYCDPQTFHTVADAVAYAAHGNEIPIMVSSSAESWAIVAGTEIPDIHQILSVQPQVAPAPAPIPPPLPMPPQPMPMPAPSGPAPVSITPAPYAPAPAGAVPDWLLYAGLGLGLYLLVRK